MSKKWDAALLARMKRGIFKRIVEMCDYVMELSIMV